LDHKDNAVYYDVKADNTRMDEMLKYSGGDRRVPVIVEGDNITVGYGGS
jgi:glutaredoxin 3